MTPDNTGVIVGGLSKNSYSLKVAMSLINKIKPKLHPTLLDISNLEMYNQDLDLNGGTKNWKKFRDQVRACSGLILVTPEYNRMVAPAMANAVAVMSRPYDDMSITGKKVFVVSVSGGPTAGILAHRQLIGAMPTVGGLAYTGHDSIVPFVQDTIQKDETGETDSINNIAKKIVDYL